MKITVTCDFDLNKIDVGKINQIGLFNASEELIKKAQENAPYESGTLKKSIAREPQTVNKGTKSLRIGPRKVVYAVRREFENRKNPGRKFYMKRTHDVAKPIVQREFEQAAEIVIKGAGFSI